MSLTLSNNAHVRDPWVHLTEVCPWARAQGPGGPGGPLGAPRPMGGVEGWSFLMRNLRKNKAKRTCLSVSPVGGAKRFLNITAPRSISPYVQCCFFVFPIIGEPLCLIPSNFSTLKEGALVEKWDFKLEQIYFAHDCLRKLFFRLCLNFDQKVPMELEMILGQVTKEFYPKFLII